MNSSSPTSLVCVIGYILQLITSGVSGLKLMAWSHGHFDGNWWDTSLLKRHLNLAYWGGISTFFLFSPAWIANSVAIPQIVHCSSSWWTTPSLSFSVSVAITTFEGDGMDDEIMTGNVFKSMIAGCHLNPGSNAASHGYPRSKSSVPMSAIRNRISLTTPLVWNFKLMKWVILPNLFSVLLMLNIFLGFSKACAPTFIHSASCGCIKQLVAPESTRAFWLLAL